MKKTLIAIIVILLSSFAWSQDKNIRTEWMKGYLKMETADKACADDAEQAAQLYSQALEIFQTVQRKNPHWNPSLLNYRINYCKQAIAKLRNNGALASENMTKSQLEKAYKAQFEKIAKLTEEQRTLSSRIEILNESLGRARSEAAKNAGVEASIANMTKERKSLEEKNMILELKLREANDEIKKLRADKGIRDEYDKTKSQLDKSENQIRQSQKELAKAADQLKTTLKQLENLQHVNDKLQREYNDQETAMRMLKEVSTARKNDNEILQNKLTSLQKRYQDLETILLARNALIERLRNKVRKSSATLDPEEAISLEQTLETVQNDAEKSRAQSLAINENYLSLKTEYEKLKVTLAEAQEQNRQLSSQITSNTVSWKNKTQGDKLKNDQLTTLAQQLETTKADHEKSSQRLEAQLQLTREQEKSINQLKEDKAKLEKSVIVQKAQIAKLTTDIIQLQDNAKLNDAQPDQIKELVHDLKKQVADLNNQLERQRKEATATAQPTPQLEKRYLALREQYEAQIQELAEAQNAQIKSETALAILRSQVSNLDENLKMAQGKQDALDGISKTINENAQILQEKNRALAASTQKVAILETHLKEADERLQNQAAQIAALSSANPNHAEWLRQIKELDEKLARQINRCRDLEMALADKETQLGNTTPPQPQAAPAPVSTTPDMMEERIRREREKMTILKGYLRQGIDAEKQQKFEAAQWNYQKVLELDSDNRTALQRLGIIASNLGNDLDTIKYLQQAFRLDPDDSDTLFALGYALLRQSKPDLALSNLSRAAALTPQNPDILKTYGMALISLGWTQPAEIQLEKAYKLKQDDPEAPFNLAVILATAKPARLDEARNWYKIALKNGAQNDPGLDAVLLKNP